MNAERKWYFSAAHLCGNTGAALLMVMGVVMGGYGGFVNIPSFLIVYAVSFFMMFACFGGEYMRFLGASVLVLAFRPANTNRRYAEMARYAARFLIASGVTGTLIGFIQMLRNMTEPSAIGSGMAVSLITVLYAVVSAEYWCVFVWKVFAGSSSGTNDEANRDPAPPQVYPVAVAFGVALWSIVLFIVILLSLPNFFGLGLSGDQEAEAYSVESGNGPQHFLKTGAFRINVGPAGQEKVLLVRPVFGMSEPICRFFDHYGPIMCDSFQSAIRTGYAQLQSEGAVDPEMLKPILQQRMNDRLAPFTENRVQEVYFEEFVLLTEGEALPEEASSR